MQQPDIPALVTIREAIQDKIDISLIRSNVSFLEPIIDTRHKANGILCIINYLRNCTSIHSPSIKQYYSCSNIETVRPQSQ